MARRARQVAKTSKPTDEPAKPAGIRDRITGLIRMRAGDLRPDPNNPRIHSLHQREVVAEMMRTYGIVDAVLAYKHEGEVYLFDGHLRRDLDEDRELPVLMTDLTRKEARELMLTLDASVGLATFDPDKTSAILDSLVTDHADMREFLDGLKPKHVPVVGIDRPQEPPETPVSRTGDLWCMGKHRLLCGDSTRAEDVARLMDGELAQMVFTDPPYGVGYTGGAKKREALKGDEIGTNIYAAALPQLKTACDDEAPLYLWYADGHAAAAAAAAAAAGYVIVAQIIWAKNHAQFVTSAHYKGKHEPCYYGHRKGKSARWHGPNNEVTLWEYNRASVNEFHPTQKPVEIAVRAIGNSTLPGHRVLDLFLGGGTTLIASESEGRICYGMEIDPPYVDVSVERWQDYTNEEAILDVDGRTFAEIKTERLG